MPFYPFLREGSPTKIDYRGKKQKNWHPYSNLSSLEDLVAFHSAHEVSDSDLKDVRRPKPMAPGPEFLA